MSTFKNVARAAGLLLSAGILAATAGSAHAGVLFSDLFNTNGALLGSTPGTSGGNWTITGSSVVNPLTVTGNKLVVNNTGQDAFSALTAPVTTTDGTSLYTGFTVNVSAATAGGDYFVHLANPAATSATNFYQRIFVKSSGTGYVIGLASNSGTGAVTTYGTTVLNFGTDYKVVNAWNFAATDTMNLYVNPTDAVETNNVAEVAGYTWTGAAEPTTLAAVNIRQGGAATGATLTLDELTVANTFAEAAGFAAVPEPGSLALIGLSVLPGVAVLRRRRAAK